MSSMKQDGLAVFTRTATFDPASVATVISAEQDVTVADVMATDILLSVCPPAALNAGLVVVPGRVKAVNTVTVRILNTTAGALDAASGSYVFTFARP